MSDELPISEVAQRRLARMVLAGWRFERHDTERGDGWECIIPEAVMTATASPTYKRYTSWTLGGLVQRQWRIYQAWMHSPIQ